jgi:hypothetical protein
MRQSNDNVVEVVNDGGREIERNESKKDISCSDDG